MPLTGRQLVELSVEQASRAEHGVEDARYQRLSDHYDVDPLSGVEYFPRYFQESAQRYLKRPKAVLPLCQAAIDILASSTIGDGILVTIGEENSSESKFYADLQKHNDLDGANALAMSTVGGIFGWALERPLLVDGAIEFERVTPQVFRAYYDNGAIGRTIRRMNGVSFTTRWDPDAQVALPRDTAIGATSKGQRVEVITPDSWVVYLDGELTPTQPGDPKVRWMPTDDGSNPYRAILATWLWNIVRARKMAGRADHDPAFVVAEEVNRVYSQMLYNLQMVFPTLTLPRASGAGGAGMALGVGLLVEYDLDGQPPAWIAPPVNVDTWMVPLKTLLTVFFSLIHTPAAAHGLGTIFGEQTGESGKAKFYEMGGLSKQVDAKRSNYRRFVEARWKTICALANAPRPWGLGASLDPGAEVRVDFPQAVVPVSDQELVEGVVARVKAHLISQVEAILESRGLDDTPENRELAQKVLDDIGESTARTTPPSAVDKLLAGTLEAGGEDEGGAE